MERTCILKLGGSIITDKQGARPVFRASRVAQIAREIADARSKGHAARLVLLHGAGSFAHPLVHRYNILDAPLSADTLANVGRTVTATRELGNLLAAALLKAGLPVVPLQTSALASLRHGRLHFSDLKMIEAILKHGGIPLLGGDMVFSDNKRTAVASADLLMAQLARVFDRPKLFFATDTDGVYETFPNTKHEPPLKVLDRPGIKKLLAVQRQAMSTRTDVTGAMQGKLHRLLSVRDATGAIFNGNTRGIFAEALSGKKCGTQVRI